jgi:hypothetical protein
LSITLVNHFFPMRSPKKGTQGSPASVNRALIYIGLLLARPGKNSRRRHYPVARYVLLFTSIKYSIWHLEILMKLFKVIHLMWTFFFFFSSKFSSYLMYSTDSKFDFTRDTRSVPYLPWHLGTAAWKNTLFESDRWRCAFIACSGPMAAQLFYYYAIWHSTGIKQKSLNRLRTRNEIRDNFLKSTTYRNRKYIYLFMSLRLLRSLHYYPKFKTNHLKNITFLTFISSSHHVLICLL